MDIIPERDDLTLGSGWFPLERHLDSHFRWVTNDATLYAATLRPGRYNLVVMIEPGPGVDLRPFPLEFRRTNGTLLERVDVRGKQRITFSWPVDRPSAQDIQLHTPAGGKRTPNEDRVLNFRVFDIDFQRGPADVLPFSMTLGGGWHKLETQNGQPFRWVANDAEIAVSQDAPPEMAIDVEAGPSLDAKKFRLQLVGERGEIVAAAEVDGRATLQFDLSKVRSRTLKLHVDGGGKRLATDPRIMNFRVFRAGCR